MRGDIDKGRALYKEGVARMLELGSMVRRGGRSMVGGYIEFLAGDPAAAEAELREGFRVLDDMGEKALLSTVAFILAEAVYLQDRFEEAEEFALVSERAADLEDIASRSGGVPFVPKSSRSRASRRSGPAQRRGRAPRGADGCPCRPCGRAGESRGGASACRARRGGEDRSRASDRSLRSQGRRSGYPANPRTSFRAQRVSCP